MLAHLGGYFAHIGAMLVHPQAYDGQVDQFWATKSEKEKNGKNANHRKKREVFGGGGFRRQVGPSFFPTKDRIVFQTRTGQ